MSQPLIMSFRPDAAEMCLDGRKTMTRRIFDPYKHVWGIYLYGRDKGWVPGWESTGKLRGPDIVSSWAGDFDEGTITTRELWTLGSSIAIKPGRTAKAVGRVMCTGLRIEHVQDITEEDARREGMTESGGPHPIFTGGKEWYATARDAFAATWQALYPSGPKSWEANPLVVVIEFRPLREGEE